MKPLALRAAVAMTAALGLAPAVAQSLAAPPAGQLLASNCFQCHGTNGQGPGFDRLAGESANEIYQELKEMQASPKVELMNKHAWGYSDEQLRLISTYFSKQSAQAARQGSQP